MSDSRNAHTRAIGYGALPATGVVVLLAIGALHFLQIVDTFDESSVLGAAYLVLIAASVGAAGALVVRPSSGSWAAAGTVAAGAIGGYVLTRLWSSPLDRADVGNWACMLGLAALFVEGALLLTSAGALTLARRHADGVLQLAPAEVMHDVA